MPQVKHDEWRKRENKEAKRIRAGNPLAKPPHKNIVKGKQKIFTKPISKKY